MKRTLKSIFALGALLVVMPLSQPSLAEDNSETTREIVFTLFEAFNRHDVEALVALYDPDTKIISPGDKEPRFGLDVVRDIYTGHFEDIPDVYDDVTRIIVDGDLAAVEFTASWAQPVEGDEAARGSIRIANFFKIEDGKIIEDITYYDRFDVPQQLTTENGE